LREIAIRSGLSTTVLFNIERGISEPKLSSIEKLARGFGESVKRFLGKYYSRN
jgi:transcriptional regulator with XRE-family HTH domain